MTGKAAIAEYRLVLLAENAPVLRAAGTAAAVLRVAERVDATVAGMAAVVAPFVRRGGGGVGDGGVWRCRQCRYALFTEHETVRHGHAAGKAAGARLAAVAEAATPAAAAFWGYAREFAARPLLHARKAGGKGEAKKRKAKGAGVGGACRGWGGGEGESKECPWVYTQPPAWALPSLLPTPAPAPAKGGGGAAAAAVMSLHCPGRHCGRVVGVAVPLTHVDALTECECGAPAPVVVVRFQRRLVVWCAGEAGIVGGQGGASV